MMLTNNDLRTTRGRFLLVYFIAYLFLHCKIRSQTKNVDNNQYLYEITIRSDLKKFLFLIMNIKIKYVKTIQWFNYRIKLPSSIIILNDHY